MDRKARTVTSRVEGKIGHAQGTQGSAKLRPGEDRIDVQGEIREAVAVALSRGGKASLRFDRTVRLAPKGGTPAASW